MSKWVDKFNEHALIGVWANLIDLVTDNSFEEEATEDSIEDIARLKKVIIHLNGIFENIDPEVTPYNHLANIQQNTQLCINEINTYKGNKNVGHLTNANTHVDTLLLQFQQIPASVYAVSEENIKNTVSAYSETIGSYITKYKDNTEVSIGAMGNYIDELKANIEKEEARLATLNAQIDTVEQTIQKQTTEFNTQYQSSEKSRADNFDSELSSFKAQAKDSVSSYNKKSDEEFKALSTKTGKIIEVLTKLQDDASRVYGVTINTLQGGAYSSYANEEKRSANWYRIIGSFLMLVSVAFLVTPEILIILGEDPYSIDWKKVMGRIPISLVVFVPAFYFARESGKHRNNEITNRRRQHILTTLDPYIELMDSKKAEELKIHVAKTVFSEVNVSQAGDEETGKLLTQISQLIKQNKGS